MRERCGAADAFKAIVIDGALQNNGMVSFRQSADAAGCGSDSRLCRAPGE